MPKIQQKQLDTSPLTFAWATSVRANKKMTASVTVADGDLACVTPVAFTPATSSANGGYVGVRANGVSCVVGDGVKVGVECYFSVDGGVTPLSLRAIVAGALPYWNGSVAGYQLSALYRIDYVYEVFP